MARSKRFSAQARVFVRKAELDAKDSRAAGAKAEVKERARRRCSSAASKVVSLLMQQRGTLLKASKAKQAAVVAADASVSHAGTNMNTRKAVPPSELPERFVGSSELSPSGSLSLSTDLLPHHRKDFHFKQKPHVPAELVQKINHSAAAPVTAARASWLADSSVAVVVAVVGAGWLPDLAVTVVHSVSETVSLPLS